MTPDYQSAAICAAGTLIQHNITAAPVMPIPILKSMSGVKVLSFAEMAFSTGEDRESIVRSFNESQDAVTFTKCLGDEQRYFVVYNQRLPFYIIQRALSRELGHIVLHHDGSRPEDVRMDEALCFALHLMCPRPLIRAILDAGIAITVETLGNLTGCYERCLAILRTLPAVSVPPELNRKIREQFRPYIEDFIRFQQFLTASDSTPVADFGTYMEGYEE
ncbi:MAG: hypothetical protein J6S60_04730 [Oscillospiraceae bacterium]|nr:hypothetical protein [Oscillospiraceae bacterium]